MKKKNGDQFGGILEIRRKSQELVTRFYIKTHSAGIPHEDSGKEVSNKPCDIRELFIYELLYQVGKGPKAYFIKNCLANSGGIYVATEDQGPGNIIFLLIRQMSGFKKRYSTAIDLNQ